VNWNHPFIDLVLCDFTSTSVFFSSVPTNADCLSGPVTSKSWSDWVCFCVRFSQDSLISNLRLDCIYYPCPPVELLLTPGEWRLKLHEASLEAGQLSSRIAHGSEIYCDRGIIIRIGIATACWLSQMPSRCRRFHAILGSLLSSLTVIIVPLPNEQCAL